MNTDPIEELERLVSKLIDGRLSSAEATLLNSLLLELPQALARYHELLDNHEALCAIYPGDVYEVSLKSGELSGRIAADATTVKHEIVGPSSLTLLVRQQWLWATAAAILVAVGLTGYFVGQKGIHPHREPPLAESDEQHLDAKEQTIAGHATLRRALGVRWSGTTGAYREGDVLPAGKLQFDDGVAEIDFFCGATLIVEGPAKLDLESDWSVRVDGGRLRASVPPAARGFVVKAVGSEIVDLGTEFALEVGSQNARVEVIDGEVELRGGEHNGNHLTTGQRQWLRGSRPQPAALEGLSTIGDLRQRSVDAEARRFVEWKLHALQLAADKRLIAYFPIAENQAERIVRNAAGTGSDRDGQLVGPVDRTNGRFGSESSGLEFDRPGARVRTRIDGEFQAFTFACWVRIDGLDHRYNALFMGDGYENGEPHWQIRDDGRLMFSVMVDDTQEIPYFERIDQRIVKDAGLHHVYLTKPFWDISKSGRWFHLVAVYDPIGRRVVQYVNGERLGDEEIADKFHVTALRIGPAEIGNWGQPFRSTPWFAVRNLNGTIDELSIFNATLSSDEIQTLYEEGKPLGY